MNLFGKSFPKRFCAFFCVLAVIACWPSVVGMESNSLFYSIENVWHDLSFTLRKASLRAGDPRLILVTVDDDTLGKFGFPLPRKVYTQAIKKLKDYGVKTIVFDVFFTEKGEGDMELAAATKSHGKVIHLFVTEKKSDGNVRLQMAIKPLKAAAQYLGSPSVDGHIDKDGHIRTFMLFDAEVKDPIMKGLPGASLAAVAVASFLDKSVEQVLNENQTEMLSLSVLNFRKPANWLKHENSGSADVFDSPYRTISLMDVVSGNISSAQRNSLKGALVMIGSSSMGYFDHYPSPFNPHTPGPEFQLTAIDNTINGDAITGVNFFFIPLLVIASAWFPYFLLCALSPVAVAVAVAATIAAMIAGSLSLAAHGTMLHPVAPILTLIVSFIILTVHKVFTEGAEKKAIRELFGQFVAPEVVEQLANDPAKVKLGGEKRELTIFFLDIAHFTNISEKMDSEALIQFLNKYLTALSAPILESRGTVDKYIGDCIMAFWNAPVPDPDHRKDAVLTALACQRIVTELNKTLDPGVPEMPSVRIGINSGMVTVALTGTQRKLQYTAIGDEVNLASRLEGANKFFGSKIIISASTYEGAKDSVEARFLGRVQVIGKTAPVSVYEPLAEKGTLTPAWAQALPLWEKGVTAFYDKKYEAALAAFEDFVKLLPEDGPGELYLNQSRGYAVLPPDDWDMVFKMTAK